MVSVCVCVCGSGYGTVILSMGRYVLDQCVRRRLFHRFCDISGVSGDKAL